MIGHNLRNESVSPKSHLNFPKNFVNFWSDTIEEQGIRNLNSYSSMSYASVIPSSLFGGEEDAAFHPFIYSIFLIYSFK